MTELFCQQFPSTKIGAPQLLLLHGWGMSSVVWREWLPLLQTQFAVTVMDLPGCGNSIGANVENFDAVVQCVAERLPARTWVLGWSLGGTVAIAVAARHPERVSGVITIATNPCFVVRPDWPWAMAAATFDEFARMIDADRGAGLKRFTALQAQGDDNEKTLLKTLRKLLPPLHNTALLASTLNWLRDVDCRQQWANLTPPLLAIFGADDALVPVAAAAHLPLPARAQTHIESGRAHAPFLSAPEAIAAVIFRFVDEATPRSPRKQAIAHAFSKAATTYDRVATLQQDIGRQLLAAYHRETWHGDTPLRVLDLGSGTGGLTPALCADGTREVIGIDLAEGMVRYARARHVSIAVQWLCADAEYLPLTANSVDVIFSNLALQWSEDPLTLFAECQRVLKPGGAMLLSTLGPETLWELRAAWRQVDNAVHVNAFSTQAQLEAAIAHHQLHIDWWREELLCLYYEGARDLMRELKAIGAHNNNPGRPGGLTGKRRLQAVEAAYENYRQANRKLPASYQVWIAKLTKRSSAS